MKMDFVNTVINPRSKMNKKKVCESSFEQENIPEIPPINQYNPIKNAMDKLVKFWKFQIF